MAPPANWETITVEGTYITPDGLPATGTVTFTNSLYLRDPDLDYVIVPKPIQVTLVAGEFSVDLQATDDPDIDPTFYYIVTEVVAGVTTSFPLFVPKDSIGGVINLADVDRNVTIPPEPEIYVRSINGMYGDILVPDDLGKVPTTRQILNGTGITGGGDLSADRTLSVVPDTTVQRSEYAKAAALISTRKRLNLQDGANISITVADNAGQNRTDLTVAATGLVTGSGVSSMAAGLHNARPAAGTSGRMYLSTDLKMAAYDNGTDWVPNDQMPPLPKSWTAVGHSYLQFTAGSHNQRSRLDSIVKNRWNAESSNWINFAIAGSCVTKQGASQGGWGTFWREINKLPGKVAPYTSSDGGLLLTTGINDLGTMGGATVQMQGAFGHALRSMISRWRASTIKEDTDASVGYTGSWSNGTDIDHASNGTFKFRAGAVTGDVVTVTLPADYDGSPVVMCWMGRPGTNGGTIQFAGTALAGKPELNSTINTNDTMPALSFSHVPVIKRITSLTSANAGQTITMTVTVNLNEVQFDCWWIEAKEAPPVILCNVARLTASGYSTKYSAWNAAPVLGSCDADVAAFNTVMTNVVAEFDAMVQVADIDTALNKTAALFTDGLHPNELGAALCADAIDDARRRLSLTGRKSPSLNFNMAPRYGGGIRRRRTSAGWYTADHSALGTAFTPVAGDMYALPFEVTEGDEQYARFAIEATAGTTTSTIRWGVFSDYMNKGYPDINLQELTFAGAFTVTTGAGVKMNPAAQFLWWPDVALYWFLIKFETIGTGFTVAALQGPSLTMPQGSSTGAITGTAARAAGYKWTGQAAGAFPTTAPTGGVLSNVVPYMAAQKS